MGFLKYFTDEGRSCIHIFPIHRPVSFDDRVWIGYLYDTLGNPAHVFQKVILSCFKTRYSITQELIVEFLEIHPHLEEVEFNFTNSDPSTYGIWARKCVKAVSKNPNVKKVEFVALAGNHSSMLRGLSTTSSSDTSDAKAKAVKISMRTNRRTAAAINNPQRVADDIGSLPHLEALSFLCGDVRHVSEVEIDEELQTSILTRLAAKERPTLKSLSLLRSFAGLEHFLASSGSSSLAELRLFYPSFNTEQLTRLLSRLSQTPSLKTLGIETPSSLTSEGMGRLESYIASSPNIVKLEFETFDDNLPHIVLHSMKSLETVKLDNVHVSGQNLRQFLLNDGSTVKDLDIRPQNELIDGEWIQSLAEGMSKNSSLKKFHFCPSYTRKNFAPLFEAITPSPESMSRLQVLEMKYHFSSMSLSALLALLQHPQCGIKRLGLDTWFDDAELKQFLTLMPKCTSLENLGVVQLGRVSHETWCEAASAIPDMPVRALTLDYSPECDDVVGIPDNLAVYCDDNLRAIWGTLLPLVACNTKLEQADFTLGKIGELEGNRAHYRELYGENWEEELEESGDEEEVPDNEDEESSNHEQEHAPEVIQIDAAEVERVNGQNAEGGIAIDENENDAIAGEGAEVAPEHVRNHTFFEKEVKNICFRNIRRKASQVLANNALPDGALLPMMQKIKARCTVLEMDQEEPVASLLYSFIRSRPKSEMIQSAKRHFVAVESQIRSEKRKRSDDCSCGDSSSVSSEE